MYQAVNRIGSEKVAAPVFEPSWHPVLYDGRWWLMHEGYLDWFVMPGVTLPWILINDVNVG
jgi:hypothetical protein